MNANSAYISRVHGMLKTFLREEGKAAEWPHHLTMARLVARALQLGRSALIQTGSARAKYGLSYLTSVLLWEEPVILVAPQEVQQELFATAIPRLKSRLDSCQEIAVGDRVPEGFRGVMLTTPRAWLSDRIENKGGFPCNIPVLIDPADDLEEWTRSQLTASFSPEDWEGLRQHFPQYSEVIRNTRIKLTKSAFDHPKNPYEYYLLDPAETALLQQLFEQLNQVHSQFSDYGDRQWQKFGRHLQANDRLLWVEIARSRGQITLHSAPIDVEKALQPIWEKQTIVLIGGFLDWEANAPIYRQQLGLGELTCLKFSPNRQHEHIRLYLPDRLPLPNTPEFLAVALQQLRILVAVSRNQSRPVVILVEDVPLKAQVGASLAAEFGSSVQVEKPQIADHGILICGWEFWRSHFSSLPTPQLLVITTLPLPSIEHPLVAARVAYYKHNHRDWFRLYLLPTALRELQRAVVPLRESQSQGVVALLDNRVNHRSYGSKILAALEPLARINYIDWDWFS